MLSVSFSRHLSMAGRNLCMSRKGVWLHPPGEGCDSWPSGMGQAEADGLERQGWRGDRWQHGTAREGDIWQHGIGRSTSPYTGPNYRPGGSGFAWDKVKGLLCFSIPPQTWAGMPRTTGCGHGCVLDRDVSHCRLLSLSEYLFCCFSI